MAVSNIYQLYINTSTDLYINSKLWDNINISVSKKLLQITVTPHKMVITATSFKYLLTFLLTPWSKVLLEKLTGSQLDMKFPAFYGTRRFITAFTIARHFSLS
jgi:hypothetical protein